MEVIVFNITMICAIVIACNLLVFELIGQFNIVMLAALMDLGVVLAITFAYFYLSERITSDLLEIDDIFYYSPWYRLPTNRQKLLVLPIIRGGRVVRLKGLGLFDCSLPVFSKVFNWKLEQTSVPNGQNNLCNISACFWIGCVDNSIGRFLFSYDAEF